jgi:putative hemolysin
MILVFLTLVAVAAATYLSVLNLSLPSINRTALQRELDEQGRPTAADWLYDKLEAAMLATAFLRTLARMSIYIMVLAAIIGLRDSAVVDWSDLILAGLVAALVIWFTTIVLGTSIARHAGIWIVARNLPVLNAITWVCAPLANAGLYVDKKVRQLAGPRTAEAAEDDLLQSIEDVQREGALDFTSAEILENVVEFTNTEVSQIMTTRTDIEAIEYTNNFATIRQFIYNAGHSRIPVFKGTIDNIVGILYLKDLIRYLGQDVNEFKLAPLLRQPIVVPETKPVRELLGVFQRSEVHMAIVIDEYGSVAGLVTIEDVLEQIVGDIRDEHEPEEEQTPAFRAIDEHSAEVDGRFRIHDLNEHLRLHLPEDGEYETVAGFMLAHFGRVPSAGEAFESHNARFTTLAATPTSVQRVGIQLLQPAASNGEQVQPSTE